METGRITFCRCIMLSRSPKGDSSGLSNARRANVLSISVRHSRLSSPCSANCVWANSSAASVSLSLMSSIRCCCWNSRSTEELWSIHNPFQQEMTTHLFAFTVFQKGQQNHLNYPWWSNENKLTYRKENTIKAAPDWPMQKCFLKLNSPMTCHTIAREDLAIVRSS